MLSRNLYLRVFPHSDAVWLDALFGNHEKISGGIAVCTGCSSKSTEKESFVEVISGTNSAVDIVSRIVKDMLFSVVPFYLVLLALKA